MVSIEWISVKEAADIYGLSANYFRRNYCGSGGILDRLHGLRNRKGPGGKRRILVLRAVVEKLVEEERGRVG